MTVTTLMVKIILTFYARSIVLDRQDRLKMARVFMETKEHNLKNPDSPIEFVKPDLQELAEEFRVDLFEDSMQDLLVSQGDG